MSNVQGFNQNGGSGGNGILTINSNPPDGSGNYGLSGLNGLVVTQGTASSVISTKSGAFSFIGVVATSQQAVAGNAYILENTLLTTVALPVNAGTAIGDTFKLVGTSGPYRVSQAANQLIIIGQEVSTPGVGGYAECLGSFFNAITLTCVSLISGTYVWIAIDPPQGNFTVN